jgi:hypothetical protein
MADEALANADIEDTDILPPPPEVIVIDDKDDVPLLHTFKQSLQYLPKLEPTVPNAFPPTSTPPPLRRNPPHNRALPQHLGDYHLYATMAEDTQTSFPYVNANGDTVDLAIQDEHTIAKVCHYVMVHCAESTFIGNPKKKNMDSKRAFANLLKGEVRP